MESPDPELDLQSLVEAPPPNEGGRVWLIRIPESAVPLEERVTANAMLLLASRDLAISGFSVEWRLQVSGRSATAILHQPSTWGIYARQGKVYGTARAGRYIELIAKSHDSLFEVANTSAHELRHLWQTRLGLGGDREADARQYAEDACNRFWPRILEWLEESRLVESEAGAPPRVQFEVRRRELDLMARMLGEVW